MADGAVLRASAAPSRRDVYRGYAMDAVVEGGAYNGLRFTGFKYGIAAFDGNVDGTVAGPHFGTAGVSGKITMYNETKLIYRYWMRVLDGPHANKFVSGFAAPWGWATVQARLEDAPVFEGKTSNEAVKEAKAMRKAAKAAAEA